MSELYQILREEQRIDGKWYTVYGIACDRVVISNVTADADRLRGLIALCNALELSPLHLPEVVEDFLLA